MKADTDAMIRVDQAGEFGATRIYAGQLAIMDARHPAARQIAAMAAQEARHRIAFDAMITARRIRPTMLQPFWNAAGYGLGMATALMGPEAAMACTVAVETVIDEHYGEQLQALGDSDPELSAAITDFRADEAEHKQTALAAGAETAFAYPLMSAVIRMGCRTAIALSKRL
jgi:3-demethoxyubiquinol 3-hydroxylase